MAKILLVDGNEDMASIVRTFHSGSSCRMCLQIDRLCLARG